MALSYFDKAVIFLLPILVLQLFKDQTVYLSIEYIYSVTIVVIPFLDLGLAGYFYYIYRNKEDKQAILKKVLRIFHLLYGVLFIIGILLVAIHYFIFPFDDYIIYIVSRALFLCAFAFLSSYYRLINKPHLALVVTISANVISLIVLFLYVLLGMQFELWIIFIGQILFCIIYFTKIISKVISKWHLEYRELDIVKLIKDSLAFSWPTILQAFIMMYIANFGKINALDKMSLDDGVLLSLTQRFSMIIFLTHSSLLAFFVKELYTIDDLFHIKKKLLFKYLSMLMTSVALVAVVSALYLFLNKENLDLGRAATISSLIIIYTLMSCILAYLEMHYGRENKNIIKLYIAVFLGAVFMLLLYMINLDFLEKITLSMFVSTFAALLLSVFILYKRNYKLN